MLSELLRRIKHDVTYRIKLFLYVTFIFNVAYSVFLFIISQIYSSKWFFILALYYGLLSVIRIFVYLQLPPQKQLVSKIKTMLICGYFLLLLNLIYSIMAFVLISENNALSHHEIIVITLATYTFTTLTIAIINGIKYLRKNDYLHTCIKIISLISASVSLVALTNTMLSTFGDNNLSLRNIILPILSIFVSIFIILCAFFMIYKANLNLRTLKNEKNRQ